MPLVGGLPSESYTLDTYTASYGTILMVGDGESPETYHVIAGVGDIEGPNQSINVNDKTTHSTGVPYRGKAPGLIDAGQLSFPVNYEVANPSHSDTSTYGLGYLFKNRETRNWRLVGTDPSQTTRQFRGFISEFSESYPVEGGAVRDTTIDIDGEISVVA